KKDPLKDSGPLLSQERLMVQGILFPDTLYEISHLPVIGVGGGGGFGGCAGGGSGAPDPSLLMGLLLVLALRRRAAVALD
ncbi:MAG: hypothetical protein QF464_01435, partial [Myxococcota bacterium]|nr:hypothetical protein [Myxococcota bacterium]